MKPSTMIRRNLEAGPFVGGAASVFLNGSEVAVLHRYPYGIEAVMNGEAVGAARGVKCALDTVAERLVERDPRSAAERQADADWQDYADTVASARPH